MNIPTTTFNHIRPLTNEVYVFLKHTLPSFLIFLICNTEMTSNNINTEEVG